MTAVKGLRLGSPYTFTANPSFNNHTIDASNDGVAWVHQARDTDPITHIGFRVGGRTGTDTSLQYVVTLEGVSATTGAPDGADVGGGSPTAVTVTPPGDTSWDGTWQWVALTNAYAPTRGQLLCPTFRYSSGTISGTNYITITTHITNTGLGGAYYQIPGSQRLTAGTWAKQGNNPVVGFRTASGRYGHIVKSYYSTATASTVGRRQAMKFTIPDGIFSSYTVRGIRFAGSLVVSGSKNPILGLWSSSGVIQNYTLDTDWSAFAGTSQVSYEIFFDETTLTALSPGTAYYAGLEVADAANSAVNIYGAQLDSSSDLDAWPGGSNFHLASYDGSNWTDDQTVRPFMDLILDDITPPTGGTSTILMGQGCF